MLDFQEQLAKRKACISREGSPFRYSIVPYLLEIDSPGFSLVTESSQGVEGVYPRITCSRLEGHYLILKQQHAFEEVIAVRHTERTALNFCFNAVLEELAKRLKLTMKPGEIE